MIKAAREAHILSILAADEVVSIRQLADRLGGVSSATLRRDLERLAKRGKVVRTHGGAMRAETSAIDGHRLDAPALEAGDIRDVDALVLPPIEGRDADTLRLIAQRRRIPFLAESARQPGGTYLGPDNFAAGRDLGRLAGETLREKAGTLRVLLVSLEALPNTRLRCDGFLAGIGETFPGGIVHWRVDGEGSFKASLRASLDAFQAQPDINVAFGVNDHSILAAIEASDRLGLSDLSAFSVGGEGGALFDALGVGGKLKAAAALFPEIVGIRAIDVLAAALSGAPMPDEVLTPHALVTPETLVRFYRRGPEGWALAPEAVATLLPRASGPRRAAGAIGFVPHYPAHDWYRNMERAMSARARELGLALRVAPPRAGIAREIEALRRLIAAAAARMVAPGNTILVNAGEVALPLADELLSLEGVTIVTNSLDVLERLSGRANKVILTSGEYQAQHRCLVGPSLGALFETLRVDKAFLSVDGISARFGPSCSDERRALAAQCFMNAARETIVLADHSLVGLEASHRIAPLDAVDAIVTDSGSLPSDRLAFASAGTRIHLADEVT